MGIFDTLFGRAAAPEGGEEQAVLIRLHLSDPEYGTSGERDAIHGLTDALDAAIREAGSGEYDGDEFGDGVCTLYTYGPSADALWASIEGIIRGSPLAAGGHVIKRYGGPGPETRVEHVDL